MAAVLYVFRTLVDDDIPLNAGCLKPLKVIIPDGSMLNPHPPAVGGRGQRRDLDLHHQRALRRARRRWRAGQCTMNNFTFGNERYQYYETISGGTRRGRRTSTAPIVVQTHMTNSRLTDPEVLEFRFPVRLDELRDPRTARAAPGAGAAATAACAACASSSR